jgi:hypothetical protein
MEVQRGLPGIGPSPGKRGYRRSGVLGLDLSGLRTYQDLT